MKEKLIAIIAIILVLLAVLTYPLFVKVEDGETKCSNLLGQTVKCR